MAARRVLIIDDEEIESSVLESILAEEEFDSFVISARSAMTSPLTAYLAFDLVIVDMTIGNASDSKKLQYIRKAMPGVAVLLMTDNGTIQNVLQNLAETDFGIEYVKKPFSKDEFIVAVKRMVCRAQKLRAS